MAVFELRVTKRFTAKKRKSGGGETRQQEEAQVHVPLSSAKF
jgi:hypothetical protein